MADTILLAKLMARVERVPFTTCWLWTGPVDKWGYGKITIRMKYLNQNHKSCFTHRVSWELHFGPIPEGLHVLHTCDVPCCVNPAHLYVGTHADNMHDKAVRQRIVGEKNPLAKLTNEDVRKMRELFAQGMRGVDIARQFGRSKELVHQVTHRQIWKHI